MKTRKALGALALAGVAAAAGAAFTASNTLPGGSATLGYGSQEISGVTATSVSYNTNDAGDTVESVGLVLVGDTTGKLIKIGFNDATPTACSDTGSYDEVGDETAYECAIAQDVATAAKFALVATGAESPA